MKTWSHFVSISNFERPSAAKYLSSFISFWMESKSSKGNFVSTLNWDSFSMIWPEMFSYYYGNLKYSSNF